eukprot:452043-Rhodomonas_salina.1
MASISERHDNTQLRLNCQQHRTRLDPDREKLRRIALLRREKRRGLVVPRQFQDVFWDRERDFRARLCRIDLVALAVGLEVDADEDLRERRVDIVVRHMGT